MKSSGVVTWYRTARHLPAGQAAAWILRRLRPAQPARIGVGEPAVRATAWGALAARMRELEEVEGEAEQERLRSAERVADHHFRFLNVERRLPAVDWSADHVSPLWDYHLRYFDYAVDLAAAWRFTGEARFGERYVELWSGWLDAARRGQARLEPYPTSVRCLNALRSIWLVEERLPEDFIERLLAATRDQLAWLEQNLERHLRANHLQRNLTALAWGSLAFAGGAAETWVRRRAELWSELREQVLPDGGHFERSPMYHAIALDDFLRTLELSKAADVLVPPDARPRLASMSKALRLLSRPDGTLHLFNDAANGQRPTPAEVLALADRVLGEEDVPYPSGTFSLAETGYFGHVGPNGQHRLVIDAGPPGPAYQPGHAHCDMLSFELDLAGRPVIVDSGLHGYDDDPYRDYVRSTAAHNTVVLDGGEQHEVWGTFRVARRGSIVTARGGETEEGDFEFSGACRHYHLPEAVHRRRIVLGGDGLRVEDRVEGARGHPLKSWLHLHPDFRLESTRDAFLFSIEATPGLRVRIEAFGADSTALHRGERDPLQGWYCPEFGRALPAPALELRIDANDGRTFGWRLARAAK